jgi:hypothetical protein
MSQDQNHLNHSNMGGARERFTLKDRPVLTRLCAQLGGPVATLGSAGVARFARSPRTPPA